MILLEEASERQLEEIEALESIYGSDFISIEKDYTQTHNEDSQLNFKYTLIEVDLYREDEIFLLDDKKIIELNNDNNNPQHEKGKAEEVGYEMIGSIDSLGINEPRTRKKHTHKECEREIGILFRFLLPPYYPFLPKDSTNQVMDITSSKDGTEGVMRNHQPIVEIVEKKISSEKEKSSLINQCYDIWRQQEGEICLFSCIEILKDYFDDRLNQIKAKHREQEQNKIKTSATPKKEDLEVEEVNKGINTSEYEDVGDNDLNERLLHDRISSSSLDWEKRENSGEIKLGKGMENIENDFFRFAHSTPFTEKRSIFQAHAAFIYSEDEARQALSQLKKSDKRIAKATHNIMAYRIVKDRVKTSIDSKLESSSTKSENNRPRHKEKIGTTSVSLAPIIIRDNDDDGETAAGGRLAEMLELMKAENVIVIVSRWYGGIKLGPARFKYINTAARNVLEDIGIRGTKDK